MSLSFFCATGCQEPNYRTEVVGNGQGGVEITKVPKTPAELDADAARSNRATPPVATTQPADSARLDALEQRIRQQDDEIARLKQQLNPSTAPTTAP